MESPNDLVFPKLKRAGTRMPKGPFVCEEKLDGESLMLCNGHAYGRGISTVTGNRENKWDQLPPWMHEIASDDYTVHGELHVLGGTSSDVKTALVSGRETDWNSDISNSLRFTGHGIYGMKGSPLEHRAIVHDMGFNTPRVLILQDFVNSFWTLDNHFVHGMPLYMQPDVNQDQLIKIAIHEGLEGWVLKEMSGEKAWKLKVTHTYDVVVMGTKDGKGQFFGDVGALKVGVWNNGELEEVASVSGMNEEERAWMTTNRDSLKGRVCEVMANGVCSLGRLHHPRFVRWREDKPAIECTISQLEEKQ